MPTATQAKSSTILLLIALFKLFKGLLLITVGFGALHLLHRDVASTMEHWVNVLRVDPENHFIHLGLSKILAVNPGQLRAIALGTFLYSAVFLTEGAGLLLRKRWAEYFTIVSTAGLLPLEIYEIFRRVSAAKIGVLIVNIAIVVYLVVRVRKDSERQVEVASPNSLASSS
jgi:uncharacterized membrane protein (DUF2068 family)